MYIYSNLASVYAQGNSDHKQLLHLDKLSIVYTNTQIQIN